jgi:putative CocE/NonD family hydrolase
VSFAVTTDVAVPLRDGVVLGADLWEPRGAPPGPAILWRTPYLRQDALPCGFLDPRAALARGYRIVVQDVRGMGTSGGAFEAFTGEAADGVDTIAWMAAQPWCDGDVVMAGYSYVGIVQWLAAAERPAALRAIAPSISSDGAGTGWTFTSGVVEQGLVATWLAAALLPEDERWLDDVERAFDGLDELTARLPWARGWLTEPPESPFWRARSAADRGVDVPVLSIGGWYDVLLAGTLAAHARHGGPLIVGPWAHEVEASHLVGDLNAGVAGTAAAYGLTERMCDFYDAARAGRPSPLPPVSVYVLGAGAWRAFDAWPPPGAERVIAALDGAGAFAVDPADPTPAVGGRALRLWCVDWGYGPRDQRAQMARADVVALDVAYDGPALLCGPATARLRVGDAAGDWVATLCVERAGGAVLNVAEGIARRGAGDAEVAVDLGHVCWELQPGERLRLLVAGAAWPRYAVGAAVGEQVVRGGAVELTALSR